MKEDWTECLLGDISSKITKGSTPTTYGYKYQSEGINFIKIENVIKGRIELKSIHQFISEEAHNSQKRSQLKEGDVLFSIAGTIGETCLISKDVLPANTNQAFAIINGFNKVLIADFLRKQLDSFVSRKLKAKARGGAMNNVSLTDLKELNVVLPPLVEQKAIVKKIEELFSSLDSGIADLKKVQDQLKIYRQAVLKKAFEGELTNPKNNNGDLPINWNWASIFDFLFDNKKGMATGPFGTALKKHEHQQEGVPVLGIENIGEGKFKMPNKIFVTPEKSIELKSFKVAENDIIISRSGTVGEICSIPKQMENSIISTNLIRVRLDLEKVLPKFFVYLFQGGNVREQVKELCTGSTRVFLNQTILKKLKLPLCSIEEQKEVIKEIESRLSVCDTVEKDIANSLEKAQALRHSILKKAFEGKLLSEAEIAACKKHKDYEPARVLLERIKSSRKEKIKS